MQPPRKPNLPPDFLFRLWKTSMIAAVGAVFIVVGLIAALAFPRFGVLMLVVLIGGGVILFMYRNRIFPGR